MRGRQGPQPFLHLHGFFDESSIEIPIIAGLAQLVEQLICNQQVNGSSPLAGSIDNQWITSIYL